MCFHDGRRLSKCCPSKAFISRTCGYLCHSRTVAARDGDGWVQCDCGNKHWGLHGAAGLLLVRDSMVLLQHRAPWVHNGDTWGIPGGARDSHEDVIQGALREAVEEISELTLHPSFAASWPKVKELVLKLIGQSL